MRFLLDNGADPNPRYPDGNTYVAADSYIPALKHYFVSQHKEHVSQHKEQLLENAKYEYDCPSCFNWCKFWFWYLKTKSKYMYL